MSDITHPFVDPLALERADALGSAGWAWKGLLAEAPAVPGPIPLAPPAKHWDALLAAGLIEPHGRGFVIPRNVARFHNPPKHWAILKR